MIDVIVPAERGGTSAVVRSWLKQLGDAVTLDEPLVELETDKVTQELPSPVSGILTDILCQIGAEVLPGAVLGRIRATAQQELSEPAVSSLSTDNTLGKIVYSKTEGGLALSPAVKRALKRHNINPELLEGTGNNGRIRIQDVERLVASRELPTAGQIAHELERKDASANDVDPGAAQSVWSIPHNRMRLTIAENMLNSVTVAPHVTAVFEADLSAVVAHRSKHKEAFALEGVNLTFTPYFIAACVHAMREVPAVNSLWHADRLDILTDVNVGVGIELGDKGVIVPVIQRAQTLSLLGIAGKLTEQVARARAGKLKPADVRGGTFTISNHGVLGSLFATPIIITQPQSAILGIGKLEKRVVVRLVDNADIIQIRPMCYVSLTIDHRSLDAHQTNMWLSRFVAALEEWPLGDQQSGGSA